MTSMLSEDQMDAILHHNVIGHLGYSLEQQPYIVPMCYAYDGTAIYGRTYESLKLEVLRKNPNTCFQVEDIKNMVNWKTVVCLGRFVELVDEAARQEAVLILQQRVSAMIESEVLRQSLYWPFSLSDTDNVKGVLFCIRISSKTGRFYSGEGA